MSLIFSDDSMHYEWHPKIPDDMAEKFSSQAAQVAKDYSLKVEFSGEEEYLLIATFSGPWQPIFTEEEAEQIYEQYFGDFH